jgi:type I restriction enzyme M protein
MTNNQQRAALQRQICAIANDVRGSVDGWDIQTICPLHSVLPLY